VAAPSSDDVTVDTTAPVEIPDEIPVMPVKKAKKAKAETVEETKSDDDELPF
jgi:hypothetical protein